MVATVLRKSHDSTLSFSTYGYLLGATLTQARGGRQLLEPMNGRSIRFRLFQTRSGRSETARSIRPSNFSYRTISRPLSDADIPGYWRWPI